MNEAQAINSLRIQIPEMNCIKGCTDCCGPIPFSKWEWEQIKDKRNAESITCPYSLKGTCDIYNDRPIVCRLYGTVENEPLLTCPHGAQPLFKISKEQASEITQEYAAIVGGKYSND